MRSGVVLLLVAACSWPEVTDEGVHVVVAADAGLEMCGGTLAHMDAFIASAAAEFGVTAPTGDDRITMYWVVEDFHERSPCKDPLSGGCANGSSTWVSSIPANHEFVHNLTVPWGGSSFFLEGIAVAYEGMGGSSAKLPRRAVSPLLPKTSSELLRTDDGYNTAGAFVAYLIETHGLDAYRRVVGEIERRDGVEGVDAAFLAGFGSSRIDTIKAFDATRRSCPYGAFTAKLVECAAPTIAWDGDTASLHRSLACEQDDAIGPYGGDLAVVFYTLDVPAGGDYEISVIGDRESDSTGIENAVSLAHCGGCELVVDERIEAGESPTVFTLPAGRYALRLSGPAMTPTSIGVRVTSLLAH